MFDQLPILIVEDEAIIAMALAAACERFGGVVVGPAARISDGLKLIEDSEIAAAILDGRLPDGAVTPLMMKLLELGIPFVLHSGTGVPTDYVPNHADVVIVPKPADPAEVIKALEDAIARTPAYAVH